MARRNPAALISGVIVLVDALAARLVLTADAARVFVFGRPIEWECAMRRAGLPCPTCGMTRSIVMALHGDLAQAWRIAPGGPVLLAGALGAATVLLITAARQRPLPRWIWTGGLAYGAAALVIWLGGWAEQFKQALYLR